MPEKTKEIKKDYVNNLKSIIYTIQDIMVPQKTEAIILTYKEVAVVMENRGTMQNHFKRRGQSLC